MELNKFRISCAGLIIILIFIILQEVMTPDENDNECSEETINFEIREMAKDRNKSRKKRLNDNLISLCKDGIIRGIVSGYITGGLQGAITNGTLVGVANPIIFYISEYSKKAK